MPGRLRLACCVALSLSLPGAVEARQAAPGEPYAFQLRPAARTVLSRVQIEWLEWLTAINGGDEAAAGKAVDGLTAYAAQLGLPRLPELSQGAAAKATELARGGNFDRARWALEAAERLDPGRPETSFAAAAIDDLRGERLSAARRRVGGFARSLLVPDLRFVLVHGLSTWAAAVLALVGLGLVALQMTVKGGLLYRDLVVFLNRYLPGPVAPAACLLALLWPLTLPAGLAWLLLYWSALLWGYGGRLERVMLVAVWLLVGGLPLLLEEQHRQIEVVSAPSVRALESASTGRLRGDLFHSMAIVRRAAPDNPPLDHLAADLHRRLGQTDLARATYRRLVAREPGNAAALNDLGICFYEAGDFERAIARFEEAADADPASAAAWFNLSQAHSELYQFSESERALRRAREIDSERVNAWMRSDQAPRVVAVDAGLGRVAEIRARLGRARREEQAGSPGAFGRGLFGWRQLASLPVALLFVVVAISLQALIRRAGNRPQSIPDRWWSGRVDLARRVLLPGVSEAESGRWGRAAAALTPYAALLALWLGSRLGFRLPWGLQPGADWMPWLIAACVALLLARRLAGELWGRG